MRNLFGGFFAAAVAPPDIRATLLQRLEQSGARGIDLHGGPILGAWPQFSGQGVWEGPRGAAAFDLDLTNESKLRRELGIPADRCEDPGEFLWALYERLGPGFVDRLRGAFAFALWDAVQKKLLVATDPFGIRPVVFAQAQDTFMAASRIRPLLWHPNLDRTLDLDAVYQYLFFSVIPAPNTVYQSVRKLTPGSTLSWSGTGTRHSTYYDIAYRPDNDKSEKDWCRAIRTQVRDAVAEYVPLSDPDRTGCFLSGGTDSSSVVGFYGEISGRGARSFSIGFAEAAYNELDYAHIAARHFGSEQHDGLVQADDVLDLLQRLPEFYDEPFGNSSVVPAYYCARLAASHGVEVLLGGDGGDEIFGGNERYVTNLVFSRYSSLPAALRKGFLEPLLRALPDRGLCHQARRYIRRAGIPNPDRFFSYNLLYEEDLDRIFRPEFLQLVDPESFLRLARDHYERAAPADETDRLLYLDMKFTITDNDLPKVTRMCEAAGLRVRYPLLDRELVDFTTRIPPGLKVRPGRNRYIFKRAMEGFLPGEIIAKKKHGFGLPVGPWFADDPGLNGLLRDALLSDSTRITAWVRPEFLKRTIGELHGETLAYAGGNLWVFLALELWLREH